MLSMYAISPLPSERGVNVHPFEHEQRAQIVLRRRADRAPEERARLAHRVGRQTNLHDARQRLAREEAQYLHRRARHGPGERIELPADGAEQAAALDAEDVVGLRLDWRVAARAVRP